MLNTYVNIIMTVLKGFKCECVKYEYCPTTCKFYNKSEGTCYLKACPCDYDLQAIETAVSELIQEEMDKEGENHA